MICIWSFTILFQLVKTPLQKNIARVIKKDDAKFTGAAHMGTISGQLLKEKLESNDVKMQIKTTLLTLLTTVKHQNFVRFLK